MINRTLSLYIDKVLGGLAQLGEHLPCKQGVESSNLLISTEFHKSNLKNSKFLKGTNIEH